MSSNKYFDSACEVLDVTECSNRPDHKYTDPCNCYDTYFCLNYQVHRETCAQGTAFDGIKCDHENTVLLNDCDVDQPWLRCNVSDSRLIELKQICRGSTSTQFQTSPEAMTQPPPTDKPGTDNLGLIIGLAVAGVIIVAIVMVLILLLWKRKKHRETIDKERPGTVMNPEYFENGNRDDPYAIIDDSRHSPLHPVPSSSTTTRNGSLQGPTIADTLTRTLDTVYDNSGSRDEAPTGYESAGDIMNPSGSEPFYHTLTKEGNTETENNNNTPKYGERYPHDTGLFLSLVDDSAIQVERSDVRTDEHDAEDDSPYNGERF